MEKKIKEDCTADLAFLETQRCKVIVKIKTGKVEITLTVLMILTMVHHTCPADEENPEIIEKSIYACQNKIQCVK